MEGRHVQRYGREHYLSFIDERKKLAHQARWDTLVQEVPLSFRGVYQTEKMVFKYSS